MHRDNSSGVKCPNPNGKRGPGRLETLHPVGVLDIGSNSVRMVVYEGLSRAPAVLYNEKVLCGLGAGVAANGCLDQEAMERAVVAMLRFRALASQAEVEQIHIIATAAVRVASNGAEFIDRVVGIFGQQVDVLSGAEEARFAAEGVISSFHDPEGIAGDFGGGSLELMSICGSKLDQGTTLPLGAIALCEAADGSPKTAARLAKKALAGKRISWPGGTRNFYAIGGTWRSLARLHMARKSYPLDVVHHYRVDAISMERLCSSIIAKGIDDMRGIAVVSKNRRPLLPYGAAVMRQVIRMYSVKTVTMSALGVREGYLFALLDAHIRAKDPLIEAASALNHLRARAPDHSLELAVWTQKAFLAFGLVESNDEMRYRKAACLLADISWRAHPDHQALQSLDSISNASFTSIDHNGRAYLSLATFFRYSGIVSKKMPPAIINIADQRTIHLARILAGLFRILYSFSAAMPLVIPQIGIVRQSDKNIALVVPKHLSALIGERPVHRIEQLARLTGTKIEVRIA